MCVCVCARARTHMSTYLKLLLFFRQEKGGLACDSHYPTPHGTVGYVYEYHQLKLEFGNFEPTHIPGSIGF